MDRIVVVGAGHMGSVILGGLLGGLPDARVAVVEPSPERRAALPDDLRLAFETSYRPEPGDLVILAIPPQAFESFVSGLPPEALREATVVVSVMAGIRLPALVAGLGTRSVVRAMPNLAADVGQSMTVVCPGTDVGPDVLDRVERGLSSIGRVLVVADESVLDAATAVVGSGPALVAYLTQAFTDYTREAGFSARDAQLIAAQVLRGTADMMEEGTDPVTLYQQASTPHGTTEAAVTCLREHHVHHTIRTALEKATARSRELAG